jgi:hypothetical protein
MLSVDEANSAMENRESMAGEENRFISVCGANIVELAVIHLLELFEGLLSCSRLAY